MTVRWSPLGLLCASALVFGCRGRAAVPSEALKLCIADSLARTFCGTARLAGPAEVGPGGGGVYYHLTHDIDLTPILGAAISQCGTLFFLNDSSAGVGLGLECGALWAADAGNLESNLAVRGDSLVGRWSQSCFAGCTAHGTIVVVGIRAFRGSTPQFGSGNWHIPPNGIVPDSLTAVRVAVDLLTPIYGQKQIASERPFTARLMEDRWVVSGSLPKGWIGGVAVIEISKRDGRVISVSHGK